MSDFTIVHADDVDDEYAGTSVPGEFRPLGDALGCDQLAVTLIRVPPHSDFEQGTGHYHKQIEELYVIVRGTLTMRFGDEVRKVSAGRLCASLRSRGDRTATRATSRSRCGPCRAGSKTATTP